MSHCRVWRIGWRIIQTFPSSFDEVRVQADSLADFGGGLGWEEDACRNDLKSCLGSVRLPMDLIYAWCAASDGHGLRLWHDAS